MQVELIPAFDDNYFFVAHHNQDAIVIDPGLAEPVADFLSAQKLKLKAILLTHHHADHIGGAQKLSDQTKAPLIGPQSLQNKGLSLQKVVKQNDWLSFGPFEFLVHEWPGHTLDHIVYYDARQNWLFCGDVLFSFGCGRLFEGSYSQAFQTLQRLKDLPDSTEIYCAHEYTFSNLKFTIEYLRKIDPQLPRLKLYEVVLKKVQKQRDQGLATVPTTLGFEKQMNLFLQAETIEDFQKIREARNQFKIT